MKEIKDFKNYLMENRGKIIPLKNCYELQIFANGGRMNISRKVDEKTSMLCAIDTRKDNDSIFIAFQKADTPYEIGYDGEYIPISKPLTALCDCRHPDGKIVYELLSFINI